MTSLPIISFLPMVSKSITEISIEQFLTSSLDTPNSNVYDYFT